MNISRAAVALTLCAIATTNVTAQRVRAVRPFNTAGTVKAIKDGLISITDKTGKSWQMLYSTRDDGRVSLGKKRGIFAGQKPTVEITGTLPVSEIDVGYTVRFRNFVDDQGGLANPVSELNWVDEKGFQAGVVLDRKQKDPNGNLACIVSGTVTKFDPNSLTLRLPRSRFAAKGSINVPLAKGAKLSVKSRDLSKVQAQDRITEVSGFELSTGDFLIQKVSVSLVQPDAKDVDAKKKKSKNTKSEEPVDQKYEKLSDESVAPRDVRSHHFILRTDISDRKAKMLLDKLEKMVLLLSRYYGRPQPGVTQCYVVEDLEKWPKTQFSEEVKAKLANQEGLTHSLSVQSSLARQTKAVVYAGSDPGVVQHEAVHAYCNLTFGSTGPTWYSEGMAEMGQYWKESQLEVDVNQRVIRFIRKAKEPKGLTEIVKAGQITGDSSEAYAWRWALCYMLTNNPNYNRKFKDLGIGLMMKKPGVSFSSVYGNVAKQLIFEYDQFIKTVGNGYRADLCAWKWKHRFKEIDARSNETMNVSAKAGWQPAFRVKEGVEYEVAAKGEWGIDGTGTKATADGDTDGNGKLLAAVMKDFELSEPIELGSKSKFKAPTEGDLYFRCGEDWTRLADNSGVISVYIRQSKDAK